MKCPRCQQDNPTHARFCLGCGAHLALACGSCGAELPGGARFCLQCGQPVAAGTAAPVRSPAPETYTPKHLAEKILTSKAALEGERKQVTVLFADLKGSMELLADRDPEEARKILDPVLEWMMEAVHHYEGTVNQVMGDGIMALFGAPLAHEDHAVRACYAALRMQESVKRYAQEVRRTEAVSIQIRVGLNSGEVVVRSIGSDLRMDYTAVGQTTHLAARMEQLATPGSILLTTDTLRLVEGYVQVAPLGPVNVKGLPAPVEVYELTAAGLARTRLQAAAIRGLTRFVGREAEVEHLRRVLAGAGAGHGQVVAIVGEAGVGKSRLVHEFTHSHRVENWLALEAASVSYGKATSYLPVIELLKGYFKIGDRDDHREMRDKVLGRVLGLDRALESLVSPLLATLDLPVDDPAWQALDPPQRRQRTLDAVKRLLLRESQVQPLLVVFEDLHWIDSETQALLDNLVESLGPARILLLVNYRPEYEHRWGSKTFYTQLRLDTLPPQGAEELLHALLGDDAGLEPLEQILITRTEGNPFYLEESVRTLVETGALVGERGAYRLAHALEAIRIPATVQVVLAARIDRLPAEEKRLLQAASVIGQDVSFAVLQAITEVPEEELRRRLAHLQAAEFLYETSLFPDLEYTFKHALTHEVAYASLLQERRRTLHALIVEAMERLYADRLPEHVERLGHHAFRGEAWEKAVTYLRTAGAKALGRSANREAGTWFEHALTALQHLPDTPHARAATIDLRLDLRTPLYALGELERLFENLQAAQRLAEQLADQRRLGLVCCYLAEHLRLLGDRDRAIAAGDRALSIAEAVEDFPLRVMANFYLGLVWNNFGEYRKAAKHFTWNVESLTGDLAHERFGLAGLAAVLSRAWLVWCLAESGEFAAAAARGEEAVGIAEVSGQPWSLAAALFGIGGVYLRQGALDRAVAVLERGVRICESGDVPLWFHMIASCLGYAHALSGRLDAALPILEQAVKQAGAIRVSARYALGLSWLSEAYLIAERTQEAAELATRALRLSQNHNERGHEAWIRRLLAEIAARRDPADVDEAVDHFRQATAIAGELGMRPLVAHCHFGLGRIYRRVGRRTQAEEHLSEACAMFAAMAMTSWSEQARAEQHLVG
jgi:class 3 adenylate cyclase/tetratricopeptide (TPR) repeat protein